MHFRVHKKHRQERRKGRPAQALLLATTTLAVLFQMVPVSAQTVANATASQAEQGAKRQFNIPVQSLNSAVSAFGRQSGLQVTLSSTGSGNVRTNSVVGSFTPREALAQMLGGTGVSYRLSANGKAALIGSQQSAPGTTDGEGTILNPIVITAKSGRTAGTGSGFQGTPDWVYEEPASVSVVSQEAIKNSGARNARDLLDNVAGVQANRSEANNPGVQVNIRGLQDNNRVTTMIDGARQNFQRGGHGGTQQVYVDTSFLRGVEVEKTSGYGVGGAGSLGGSVNFRTVTADDIIKSGQRWGVEANASTGSNAFDFEGNTIAGIRLSDDFAIIGGVSHKRLGDFKAGKHGQDLRQTASFFGGQVLSSGLESTGTLLKIEGTPTDDFKFDLSWLRNDIDSNKVTQGLLDGGTRREDDSDYLVNTVTSSFSWDPESDLIDLKGRLWFTDTQNDEVRDYSPVMEAVSYGMKSWGGSLENTSRFDTPVGKLSLNYGVEAFRDKGKTERDPTRSYIDQDGVDWFYGYQGMNPSGNFNMTSGFLNATLEHDDWLMVRGGLRYDHYNLKGEGQVVGYAQPVLITPAGCLEWRRGRCIRPQREVWGPGPTPVTMLDVDKSGGALLPSVTVAVKPFEWIQPFVSYTESYRPPSIMETLFSGGHPNVAPVDNIPNPNLRPESGKTWEIGANIMQDGLISADDSLRMKVVYFNRNIKDFISMGRSYYAPFNQFYDTHVNLDGTTKMRGFEVEASYDVGFAYAGLSYTRIDTDFADSYTHTGPITGNNPGSIRPGENPARPAVLFQPPRDRVTVDAGVRLFEQALVLGGRMTYVGETMPAYGQLAVNNITQSYTVFDIYGSYAFTEQTKLRFAVNNVTDEAYLPSLGSRDFPAPGRTFIASLNVKF